MTDGIPLCPEVDTKYYAHCNIAETPNHFSSLPNRRILLILLGSPVTLKIFKYSIKDVIISNLVSCIRNHCLEN